MKLIRPEPEASTELSEAVAWYEQQRPGLGAELLAAADEAIERLRNSPSAGGSVPGVPKHLPVRRILMRRFPYAVVFMDLPGEISVIAFAHASRRPGYWRERLGGKQHP